MNTEVFGSVQAGCCRCTIDCRDQLLSVRLSGEIDQASAATIREKIDQAAESCLPQTLMLDLSGITFMDSSGIAIVISAIRHMREIGGKVLLRDVPAQPMKVLLASGIDKIVQIEERSLVNEV